MARQLVSSGGPFEAVVGYSRAVRTGDFIAVSGTTAIRADGRIEGGGDGYLQARRCFEIIAAALAEAGATMADVIRTRMFVTDIGRWEEFARAHAECFADVRPAATMVEVQRLISPGLLIEVEVDAVAGSGGA